VRQITRRRLLDRRIVELLVDGDGHREIRERLRVGTGRLAKVKALAEAHGYLRGVPLPPYPELVFPDRVDRRESRGSDLYLPPPRPDSLICS